MEQHKTKHISKGKYLYRGFIIQCAGYHQPDHHTVWECSHQDIPNVSAHGYSLKECKKRIDILLEQ